MYSAVSIFQKGIAFLLLPLYTHYLTPDDYGILSVITAVSGLLVILFTLSLNGAMTRFYFEYRDDPKALKECWGTILTLILTLSMVFGILLLMTGNIILRPLIGGIPFWPFVAIGVCITMFQPFFTIFLSLLQIQEKVNEYAVYSVAQFFLNLLLVITLVIYFHMGALGALVASLITAVVFFAVSLYAIRSNFQICLIKTHVKAALAYSLPLVPHSVTGQIMSVTDRILLNYKIGTATAGLYNIGFTLGSVLGVIADSVNRAYVPASMEALQTENADYIKELSKIGMALVGLYCLAGSFLSIFSREVVQWTTTKAFHESYVVIPYVVFAFILNGVYYLFVNILFFVKGKTKYVAIGTAVGAAANVALNLLLIPGYKMVGSAIATLLAQLLSTIVVAVIGAKFDPVKWGYFRMGSLVALCLAVSVIVANFGATSISLVLTKLLIFTVLCFITGFVITGDLLGFPRMGLGLARRYLEPK